MRPDVGRLVPELPLVHRDDRTMAAQVLAAAAGISGPDDSPRAIRHLKRGVSIQRQQPAAIRHQKQEARDGAISRHGRERLISTRLGGWTGLARRCPLAPEVVQRLHAGYEHTRARDGALTPPGR